MLHWKTKSSRYLLASQSSLTQHLHWTDCRTQEETYISNFFLLLLKLALT